jgi:hypothetical protein
MPFFMLLIERANQLFSSERIAHVSVEAFGVKERLPLWPVLRNLEIARTDAERDTLEAWPPILQRLIVGLLRGAVAEQVPVTASWVPGYDYQVAVSQAHATPETRTHITLLLQSPYPSPYRSREGTTRASRE